jgi:hypothetical protein
MGRDVSRAVQREAPLDPGFVQGATVVADALSTQWAGWREKGNASQRMRKKRSPESTPSADPPPADTFSVAPRAGLLDSVRTGAISLTSISRLNAAPPYGPVQSWARHTYCSGPHTSRQPPPLICCNL